ncbi:Ig-like domain-containing protein [Hymenobacter sp. BT175]|uniref:Ig-like domain-containing domain n=1 Tax=Hymenobacter translucens TaxID=2886507 RepID=UPI001D0E7A35|nr:Ig-like domain-containing domain [Hymenobacter translucens]MCC2545734.1 Ig-like domain-containing protein [Hymenobacter translucens]
MFVRANLLFLLSVGGLAAGCAAISSPLGGPEDKTAPRLVSTSPDSAAVNVRQQSIRLVFSEPVQLKDLSKNLIVAPQIPEENKYKVREERNAITLIYDKPLDPNTTYSFNFRDAIADITESNLAKNVQLTFSTGPVLDSAAVRGTVVDLFSGQPADQASVMLYPEADTLNVRRGRPYYLARTDKEGGFQLQNLRNGRYRIYALADKNSSGRYDEGEKIAYLPQLLAVGPRQDSLRLVLVRPDARRPLISSQQPGPTQFRVAFQEGLQQATVSALGAPTGGSNLANALQLTDKGRTVALFRTPALGEGRFLLATTDSAGNVSRDTVNVRFQGTAPKRRAVYTVEGSPRQVYRQAPVRFQFPVPILLAANKPFGTLVEDSVTRRALTVPKDAQLSSDRTVLVVNLNTKAKKSFAIQLDSTALTSVTGERLSLPPFRARVSEESATGSLAGTIQTRYPKFQLQLLDATYQVVASLDSPKGTFRFDNLSPASYRFRVLIDTDANGSWRGPDPQLLVPTEPVVVFPESRQVRANWEIEDIKLSF